ncbi:YEATS and/or MIP-T3 domain containing protein [Asbolus verrucosus]|uniref:YEATS and/or MIP-T3 domain containing protein n=1 Tax=Asbolus verrucosus TaxID=1661398 RepID=A0A482W3P4_ASBVE|nr:YEATS and/or MIP-T3 domain containing protein [Asbolus verrucosus]
MAVRIYLEIGHEASIRTKKTQEGFTHDWEVFVRGCEGAEIHYYIEKVVFYLHETFPKPKRVVKEPPYSVKESGYAGFNLPIDIYLRNNNEPKKIRFNYDLHLQQSGPAILKVQKEKYVFNSPTEEFKMKLLKGGGTIGSSSSIPEVSDSRSSIDDKNQMTNKPKLGGCDLVKKQKIKTGEPCRDFQELFGSPITMSSKMSSEQKLQIPKQDSKGPEKSRTKHSPHKDSHKDKEKSKDKTDSKSKEEKKQKEKSKDRERSKDKSIKKEKSPRPKSPSPKRSPKRPSSPSRFSSPPVIKHKEPKQHDKDKRDKFEDRKAKKEKRSKDHKENKHGDEQKSDEHKESKMRNESKKESTKTTSPPPKVADKKEKSKEKSSSKEAPKEEKNSEKSYSEKYKHKKKDKEKRDKKDEKPYKSEKKPEKTPEPKPNLFKSEPQLKKEKALNYLNTVIHNIDEESSNSSTSSSNSSVVERQLEKKPPKSETIKPKEEKNQKLKKEKGYQESAIKCKRKSSSVDAEEPPEKTHKEHSINNNSDLEPEVQVKTDLASTQEEEEDYFGVLRDLQHKIMGLKDNSDLQKVVKLIAETGRYEVSAHTFDFDLCLLDRSTVQQLQDFFASET